VWYRRPFCECSSRSDGGNFTLLWQRLGHYECGVVEFALLGFVCAWVDGSVGGVGYGEAEEFGIFSSEEYANIN
jgi:hypothetical protein